MSRRDNECWRARDGSGWAPELESLQPCSIRRCSVPGPDLRSFTAAHVQTEYAVLRKIRIVIKPQNLQPVHGNVALLQLVAGELAPALELLHGSRLHAFHRNYCCIELAEIERLAKRKIVRMEKPARAIRIHPVAECLQYCLLNVATEMIGRDTDVNDNIERDKNGRVD